jgi:hypothetical protein
MAGMPASPAEKRETFSTLTLVSTLMLCPKCNTSTATWGLLVIYCNIGE